MLTFQIVPPKIVKLSYGQLLSSRNLKMGNVLDLGATINVTRLYSSIDFKPPLDIPFTVELAIASNAREMSAIVVRVFPRPISCQNSSVGI